MPAEVLTQSPMTLSSERYAQADWSAAYIDAQMALTRYHSAMLKRDATAAHTAAGDIAILAAILKAQTKG